MEQTSEEWLSLDDKRVAKFFNNGNVVVVKPKDDSLVVPLFCPVCQFPIGSSDDSLAYRSDGACSLCCLYWMIPYAEQIKNGQWSPSVNMPQQWEAYLAMRNAQSKSSVSFV